MAEELPPPDISDEQRNTAALLQRLLGKRIADRYVDFCRLAGGGLPLRVSVPLAGHAMREIEAVLRQLLATPADLTPVVCPEEQERLQQAQAALRGLGYDATAANRAVSALAPKLSHRDQIERIVARLGLARDGDIARSWKSIMGIHGRAHYGRELHQSLEVDAQFRSEWQAPFDVTVRGLMIALQGKYAAYLRRIDELLAMPDRRAAVQALSREIPGALPLLAYFFQRLETPDWLDPLSEHKLLAPPRLSLDDLDDGLRLQHWPAGGYLTRMAAAADASIRKTVANALKETKDSDDLDVQWHGAEALASLPAAEAADLLDVVESWLAQPTRVPMSSGLHKLIKNFADAGQFDAAIRLMRSLYRVFSDDGKLATLFSQHMYEHFLPEDVRACAARLGPDLVGLLCEFLDAALRIERRVTDDPPGDYSHHMSRDISEHGPKHGVVEALVGEIIRSAKLIVAAQPDQLPAVVGRISRYSARLFIRIRLHVLALNPGAAPDVAASNLTDPSLIGETWCSTEYGQLALAWFPQLPVESQKAILDTVDGLPSRYLWKWTERFAQHEGREPGDDEKRRFERSVVRDVLWGWRDVLPADRRDEVERSGDPEAWIREMHEPDVSPLAPAEFATRPIDDVVAFLNDWRPSAEDKKQTVTALGQQLRQAAEQNAAAYSESAAKFLAVPAIYARRILEGLTAAVRNKSSVNWHGILGLTGPLASPTDQPSTSGLEGDDRDWRRVQKEAMELLSAGLVLGKEGIAFELADEVRSQVLAYYSNSPAQPDVESFEETYARQVYFGAQSTSRGAALELCIRLIFWLSKNPETEVGRDPANALRALPEIGEILEAETARVDPAARIPRAIIGRYLAWLSYFAAPFLTAKAAELFQTSDADLRDAAWLSHIQMDHGPLQWLAGEMSDCYRLEIDRLGQQVRGADRTHLTERFSHYLVILYIFDALPEDVYELFWNTAPVEARQQAMWFLGSQLALPDASLPEEKRLRARSYWDRRLAAATTSAAARDTFRREIGAIGQFYYQRGIEPDWLMQQTIAASNAGYSPGETYNLIDRLADFSSDHPHRAVQTVAALIRNRHIELMELGSQPEKLRMIFVTGLSTGDASTGAMIAEAINFLAVAGNTSCLDLLPRSAG